MSIEFDSYRVRVTGALNARARNALRDVGLDLQRRATNRAPVDTGDLRGSGNSIVEETPDGVIMTVGFATDYAVEQHENLAYNHPRGGEAKYLERPYLENKQRYIDYIRDALAGGS